MKRLRNWILFLIVVLIWGSCWPIMKITLGYIDPLNLVFQRLIFSALVLSPLFLILWKKIPRDAKNLTGLLFLGILNALFEISVNIGMLYEKSGIGAVLTYTQPFFVFCMAVLFLKENAKAIRFLGIFTGFIGVVVLLTKETASFENLNVSILFLIVGAFFWAVSSIYYKKFLSQIDPVVTNIVQLYFATVVVALTNINLGGFYFPFSMSYLPLVLYLGVGASGVATTIWYFLLREEEVTVLSSSSLIVPMFAFLFGWLLLGETAEPRSLLGAALIIMGLYLVNRQK